MTQTRRRFPESFKREAVDQMLAGTPLRHVSDALCLLPGGERPVRLHLHNHRRHHSALDYLSPMEFERRNMSTSS